MRNLGSGPVTSSRSGARRRFIGVDMGGTKILAAVVGADGKILGSAKKRTKAESGPAHVTTRIGQAIHQAARDADISVSEATAVGVGAPGPLNPDTGVVFHAPNLPGWENVPLGQRLADELDLPVFVENDVNLGTLGELVMGAGRGAQDMVGIFVGTGIGGGIIIDGKLRSGARHSAAEVGHMIVAAGGPYCGCGRQGCLEAVASRRAIERDVRAGVAAGRENLLPDLHGIDPGQLTSKVLARACEAGCPLTRQVIGRAQWYLGLHAASIVNFLDPQMMVYGGGLVEAMGEALLTPIRAVAQQHLIHQTSTPVRIVAASLGDSSVVLGAAVMAQRRWASASNS
ncbi:MAG: ROK family protein [Ardenticatenia bacterium]|nr:ROK family protein [Ardenticatenia bacterium]